ncbi:hypothetical protein ACWDUL_09985 [Nocardia niigatensis]|uniref:hypothetical protein n=1 Tax=Nocardia niigatensis TaxID=209249 RepID=UPI00031DB54A|nr:hypothetical protein [Nocardia niigatensis]
MRFLSILVRPYLRGVLAGLAAITLVIAGLYVFADSRTGDLRDLSPATPLPPVSGPLGPNWLTPSPADPYLAPTATISPSR